MKPLENTDAVEREQRQYILGLMTAQEEQDREQRLMSDDEFFRTVEKLAEVVEDELVEDYLAGKLTVNERTAFDEYLLRSPRIQAKLSLCRALLALPKRQETESWVAQVRLWIQPRLQPVWAPLAASLVVILLVGGIWSNFRIGQLESQLAEARPGQGLLPVDEQSLRRQLEQERESGNRIREQLEVANIRITELEASLEKDQRPGIPVLASFILKPGLQRGRGEVTQVSFPAGHRLVELKLDLGLDEHQSYQAALFDSDGKEVLAQANLEAVPAGDDVYVVLDLPTRVLRPDDYRVELRGVTGQEVVNIDRYYFRVSPR